MLDIHISPIHNLKMDNVSDLYAMETKLVVEISNKSITPVTVENLKIVSRKRTLLSFKIKDELSESKNELIDPESTVKFSIEGLKFEENKKYKLIVNQEFISNEI